MNTKFKQFSENKSGAIVSICTEKGSDIEMNEGDERFTYTRKVARTQEKQTPKSIALTNKSGHSKTTKQAKNTRRNQTPQTGSLP